MSAAESVMVSANIRCRDCNKRMIYDSTGEVRVGLERAFGDIEAPEWTVKLVCPPCLKVIEERRPVSPAAQVDLTCEIADRAGVELLELAMRWADNKCHVYEFTREAATIVQRALDTAKGEGESL